MADKQASPPKINLTRSRIVTAALELLQTHGLPDLSMRRLAQELGVKPGALYWHIASKQDLLAEMSRQIVAGPYPLAQNAPSVPLADIWVEIASIFRAQLLMYRDGAEIVSSSYALGLLEIPAISQLVETGIFHGADSFTARRGAHSVIHYLIGQAFHQQQQEFARTLDGQVGVDQQAELVHAADIAATVGWIAHGVQQAAAG